MSVTNTKWVLKERPQGLVKNENFELIKEELRDIQDGEVLLENQYLSFDPTQRMWLTDLPGYLPPVQIDEVVRSGGNGKIVESKNENFSEGDLVSGMVGWQTHHIPSENDLKTMRKVPDVLPIPSMLNIFGTTGITASNGVVAQDNAGNPIWTLGNHSLLLAHSSGEDIAITELTGVALNVRIANFDNTTYEDDANEVSLQAARNLIVNPITSDQQVLIAAENNSLSARYRIVGTNLAGAAQQEYLIVDQGQTKRTTNSFATVTRIDLQRAPNRTGRVDIGYSGSSEAISKNQAPVNRTNFNLNGTDVSSGTALIDPGEFIRLEVSNDTKATNFTIHGNNSLGTAITETITSNPSLTLIHI